MKKANKKPIKLILFLLFTFISATFAHNLVYTKTGVEEPFFFIIAIVSATSIPITILRWLYIRYGEGAD